ncbi:MAG: choice-of-anchor D domain-containing protein [Acidobacteriota bacterium]
MKRSVFVSPWAIFAFLLVLTPAFALAAFTATVSDISPSRSTLDPSDPDGASGGRINGIDVAASAPATMFAASEWGGLWKSTDSGQRWSHLDGHVPTATWDVQVDPNDAQRVYATSFYDGRTVSESGINVSTDGGITWNRPASAVPPAGFCTTAARQTELTAFGIAIDPADPNDIYVGTSCGLAVSQNRGATWTYLDPTPADGADSIWDVVVHDGGTIDLCGDDGHQRSTNGGTTWTTAGPSPLPGGRCSLAVSPDESYVLFAVVGTTIFESDDGGQSWQNAYANPSAQGRIPFVATNQRAGATYDLWFGDIRLFRGTCTTPASPAPGGAARCAASAAWAGPFTRSVGGHDDLGDIAFDPAVASDACPLIYSSDGGVYVNTLGASPGCHTPVWEQPIVTPHALWAFDFHGVNRAGAVSEDLYFGNQDNGSFGSSDGGAVAPAWNNERCCDGFDVAGDANRVLNTICCFSPPPATRLFVSQPGYSGPSPEINTYPPGTLRSFQQLDSLVNFGTDDYVVITSQGIFVTDDITASPIVWTEIGATSTPFQACGVQVIDSGGPPTFFVKSGGCNGDRRGGLFRYQGVNPGGTWQAVNPPSFNGIGRYAVDPGNTDRIIASNLPFAGEPEMVITHDGGATWNALPALDQMMTGGGTFQYANRMGPTSFTGFGGYAQPTLIAFDPADTDIVVAAGADSGVFLSVNGGTRWQLVTDPNTPGISGVPHIPRARYAHFDHGAPGDDIYLYLGTQGRSTWRITFQKVPVPEIQVPGGVDFGEVCVGDQGEAVLEVCNTSAGNLVVSAITSNDAEFEVRPPSGGFPVSISHDFCFPFRVDFSPGAAGPRSATLFVQSNDVNFPQVEVEAEGIGTEQNIAVTGSTDFGIASAWTPAENVVSMCNTGSCDLAVTGASIDCTDFSLVSNPLPQTLAAGSCIDLTVAFTPDLPGPKSCQLAISSDDPTTPLVTRTLTGRTPPRFSLRGGLADPHGALSAVARNGSAFTVGFVYPYLPKHAWDVRLSRAQLDGRPALPDTDIYRLSGNYRFTFNPANPVQVYLNGGFGMYHFDPGDFEGGANLGLGLAVPLGRRFSLEAAYDYHVAFTASPDLEYNEVQLGLEVSF